MAEADLGALGAQLGSGGHTTLHELVHYAIAGWNGPLVYKKYRGPDEDPRRLEQIVQLRGQLTPARRAALDQIAAWPRQVVHDRAGDVTGVVLPRIPDEYIATIVSPTGRQLVTPRELQYLLIDPSRSKRLGWPTPNPQERLFLCRDFAGALSLLHDDLDVVFGDINHVNELFRLRPETGVYLVDCDAVRPRGIETPHKQLNTPDWVPPEGGELCLATDRYKLALFVLRTLVPGAATQTDPALAARALDGAGMVLLRQALANDPAVRPTAAEWHRYFTTLLGGHEPPPPSPEDAFFRRPPIR
ncbi:hypothetical protein [Actinokineospora diospyrosa]|uniref:Protein kinase domain-containing protein n=1 Tax=Actinokineospora diospyrosa TaxID=103728 RepID=A0ABT1I808_9PSEU|nr:hypothetical protein [Actinokineospora diospyrosa]MCP2268701.1 hypothetical protein [Actinokineospora diospyrosa]